MNDPHVVALIYDVDHGTSVIYDKAKPLCRDEKAFRLEVRDKKAWFYLKDHHAMEAEARKAIEEYIRNWEFDACLQGGPDRFKLNYERAQIEDRNPPAPTPGVVNIGATFPGRGGSLSVAVSLVVLDYPSPPSDISVTPDVQTMYDRYMAHRRGHEPLTGMAYFCLTFLAYLATKRMKKRTKDIANKRTTAAKYFQIDKRVLDKVGELSTERGGPREARKYEGVDQELTSEERCFLEEAIKKIVRRVAEKAQAPETDLMRISLSDLPPCR